MKRLILYVAVMLLTFAFGVGVDWLGWRRPVKKAPAAELVNQNITEPQTQVNPIVLHAVAPSAPAAPAPAPTHEANLILDYDVEEFNPVGVYYPIGAMPKGFTKFDSIELAVSGHTDDKGSIWFHSRLGNDGDYDSASATFGLVTETRLFFTTLQTQSGIEYRFDGNFLRKDFDSVAGKNKAVLRGTLTKMKNGRTIAECTVSFRIEHLGC